MHEKYMKLAIKEATKALHRDEVPVGAIIVKDDKIIAKAYNLREHRQSSIAHAEILAIDKACKKLDTWRLSGCTMYVTLEPCPMCAGAILLSRIDTIVFGAYDYKGGSIISTMQMYKVEGYNHYPTVIEGIEKESCSRLLTNFFKTKREEKKQKQE